MRALVVDVARTHRRVAGGFGHGGGYVAEDGRRAGEVLDAFWSSQRRPFYSGRATTLLDQIPIGGRRWAPVGPHKAINKANLRRSLRSCKCTIGSCFNTSGDQKLG